MDDLVYFSFGEGRHVDELRFSILSAARYLGDGSGDGDDWRIVVYADRTEPFADLPVEVRPVTPETVAEWIGPHRYIWRAKIQVIEQALAAGADRCLYVDGDTYLVRSPRVLFDRLGPGRSLLHLREGRPPAPEEAALAHVLASSEPAATDGRPWRFRGDRASWNAGVVGLHASDAGLCREVGHLTDQLLAAGFDRYSHTSEQVAFTVVLDERTRLRAAHDVIRHYWRADLRRPFGARLAETMSDRSLSPEAQFRLLWDHRPQEEPARRAKQSVKRLAWRVGVRV